MSEQESKELGGLARTKRGKINEVYNNTPKANLPKKSHAREMAKISRTSVAYALEGQPVKIKMALDLLFDEDPRAYIDAIAKLLNYAVPKLSSTEIKHEGDKKIEIKSFHKNKIRKKGQNCANYHKLNIALNYIFLNWRR